MKNIFLLLIGLTVFSSAATCSLDNILGVFPKIDGMGCTDYAIFIGFVGLLSSYLFWEQVTK